MNRIFTLINIIFILALFLLFALPGYSAQITSADFSLGYGFAGYQTWNTSETDAYNTPITQGNFTFYAVLTSSNLSNSGPGFTDRVLTDNASFTGWVGNASGDINDQFRSVITASYNGSEPNNVDFNDPDYQLIIEVTSISIYGGVLTNSSVTTLRWDETTPGHTQVSRSISPKPATDWKLASSYEQLVWDPPDFSIDLPGSEGYNDPVERIFEIIAVDSSDFRMLDGFEIEGRVHLIYAERCGNLDRPYPAGDINNDCYVDIEDLAIVSANWLSCTDPNPPCSYLP